MRVGWLQDMDIHVMSGGAQLSDKTVFDEGSKRGHDMRLVMPHHLDVMDRLEFDLIVVSNATAFGDRMTPLLQQTPYIFYIHDFWPLCSYRLYYPQLTKCKITCQNLQQTKQLLLNSVMNIFLSPLHFRAWCFAIPELKDHPHHLHPSPVDGRKFRPLEVPRASYSVMGLNSLLGFKGCENVLRYASEHTELNFTFYGAKEEGVELPSNCGYVGPVGQNLLPELYAQAEYFIHLPQVVDPFCRSFVEAKLSGCKLISNRNIGALSYPWMKKSREMVMKHLDKAPSVFWEKIEEVM